MTDRLPMLLFIDPPLDGPTNMAVDACLLDSARPALRLYRWQPATLSLGAFQRFADLPPDLAHLPVVRRCTGGGAILHADELTYSLALPADHPLARLRPDDLYTYVHQRIARAVAQLGAHAEIPNSGPASARHGPFLCFACHARFDLLAYGQKLAGSAQRRTRSALLQHGSVVLSRTHPVQPSASLADLLARPVSFGEFASALIAAFTDLGDTFAPPATSALDSVAASPDFDRHFALYSSDEWTRRR